MKHEQIIQPTYVNEYVQIGEKSKIWRFCNIYGTKEHPVIIGDNTQIGTSSEIKPNVKIGSNCRFQYGLFVPEGVTIDDFVFIGPRVTFTNDKYPDIEKTFNGKWICLQTRVESYVSIGAGVVILPGLRIGEYAQIGGGSIVTKDVEAYSIMLGNPARKFGDIRDEKFKKHYEKLLSRATR